MMKIIHKDVFHFDGRSLSAHAVIKVEHNLASNECLATIGSWESVDDYVKQASPVQTRALRFTPEAGDLYDLAFEIARGAELWSSGTIDSAVPAISSLADSATVLLEKQAVEIRSVRNQLLRDSDWTQLPDVPLPTKDAWATYRQALRDITLQPGFPTDVVWPKAP